MVAEWN